MDEEDLSEEQIRLTLDDASKRLRARSKHSVPMGEAGSMFSLKRSQTRYISSDTIIRYMSVGSA